MPAEAAIILCLNLAMCIAVHDGENERTELEECEQIANQKNIMHRQKMSRRAEAIEITTLIPALSHTAFLPSTRLPCNSPLKSQRHTHFRLCRMKPMWRLMSKSVAVT